MIAIFNMKKKTDISPVGKTELKGIFKAVSEAYDTNKVQVFIKRDNRLKLPENVMVFQEFAYTASKFCSGGALRTLMYLFSISGYENLIGIDIKTMAEELNVSEISIQRAMNELVKYNVINKFKNTGDRRRNDYFINPVAAWRGNSFARQKFMEQMEDKKQLSLFGKTEEDSEQDNSVKGKLKPNPDF
jgi:predicted transcriptional regulator